MSHNDLESASDLPSAVPAENLQAGSRTTGALSILDLFAGPGGWDVALKWMGLDPLGVEWDDAACETRKAAGLRTLQADVSTIDPNQEAFWGVDLLIASPPCQAWSMAGKRLGEKDKEHVIACAHELAMGNDTRDVHGQECEDSRSMLVVEPIRFIRALKPTYVALEQVPPVLELWTLFATFLEQWGYSVWTGVLEAERYGVPQTRERAILIASLNGPVAPPEPTHQRYIPGEPQRHDITFDGEVLPWVSMAEALGWGMSGRPSVSVASGGEARRGAKPLGGGSGSQQTIDREREAGRWQDVDVPAPTVTAGGAGSGGPEPFGRGGRDRIMRANAQANTAKRAACEPAPTITGGHDTGDRVWERPSPTVMPGVNRSSTELPNGSTAGSVRVSVEEAAILQSFPPDHPWQGARTKQFEQIGNAVPPLLAEAILRALLDMPEEERKAA